MLAANIRNGLLGLGASALGTSISFAIMAGVWHVRGHGEIWFAVNFSLSALIVCAAAFVARAETSRRNLSFGQAFGLAGGLSALGWGLLFGSQLLCGAL